MNIKINEDAMIVKKIELKDLPDFIVITGENGTGKTQFLSYLYSKNEAFMMNSGMMMDPGVMMDPGMMMDLGSGKQIIGEEGIPFFVPNVEITQDGKKLTNIIYRAVHTPTIDLGVSNNSLHLIKEGKIFKHKFIFYVNYKNSETIKFKDINNLNIEYLKEIGVTKSDRTQNTSVPIIDQKDINLAEKILSIHGENVNLNLIHYYYIAYQPSPNSFLFSSNLMFLYIQYWARIKANLDHGEAPWETFNKIAHIAGGGKFRYKIKEPDFSKTIDAASIKLFDNLTKKTINVDTLSSGEKVILSLILAVYTSNTGTQFPDIILFDEPDAYLHPTMCKQMLDVIQKVFIIDKKIKVIMTTHSPTTVALTPELSLYSMDRDLGYIVKSEKRDAIKLLTSGLNSISVYYENRKQIFVEASFDKYYLENIYSLIQNDYLENDILLQFIKVGSSEKEEDGGCKRVCKIVKDLSDSGNNTIYGIIDWDCKNNGNERILTLGGASRYSVENYVLDPLGVAGLVLLDNVEIEKFGFDKNDIFSSFIDKENTVIQSVIDTVISQMENKMPELKAKYKMNNIETNKDPHEYKLIDERIFVLPIWFCYLNGHQLEELYLLAFPALRRYKKLKEDIINKVYRNYPCLIPYEVVTTLKQMQSM